MRSLRGTLLVIGAAVTLTASPASAVSIGEVFDHPTFSDADYNGVDERYKSDAWVDFGGDEYRLWVENDFHKLRIKPEANNNGDAGIWKAFGAAPQQVFKAQAWVKAVDFEKPFRSRLTIHFWRDSSHQDFLGECNATLDANYVQTGYVMIEVSGCRAPWYTGEVDVAIRANNGCSGCADNGAGYGTVVVDRLRFVRTE